MADPEPPANQPDEEGPELRVALFPLGRVDRQLEYLAQDIRHPGLRAKKVSGASDIWEARVDLHHRFTFKIVRDRVLLRRVGTHDILRKP